MDIIEKIISNVEKTTKVVVQKSTDVVELTKLKLAISNAESEARDLMYEIGKLVYKAYQSGEGNPELVEEKCVRLDEIKATGSISDETLGNEIRNVLSKLPCPEAADAWITWLELSGDVRLITECRKYIVVYSYSPLVQKWSQKMQNKD
jgi:hypothetical protein